jgi:threonine-phosphate decarboxylase
MIQQHGGNLREISKQFGIPEVEILDFSTSINPLGPPRSALKAILDEMERLVHYPEIDGASLREQLAEQDGLEIENVLVGNGSIEFVYLIPRVLRPKKALVPVPTFSDYERSLRLADSLTMTFRLRKEEGFSLPLDSFLRDMTDETDLVYLCNPNNPTGTLLPQEALINIVTAAQKSGAIVVVDEAFIDFVPDGSIRRRVKEFENLLILRSFTKFFGIPGLRAGALYGPKDLMERMAVHKEPWSMNRLAGAAVVAALKDESYRQETIELVERERNFLVEELSALPGIESYSSGGNYLLVETSPPLPESDRLFEIFLRGGILLRHCASFPGLGSRFFRLAVKTRDENRLLVELFQRAARRFV